MLVFRSLCKFPRRAPAFPAAFPQRAPDTWKWDGNADSFQAYNTLAQAVSFSESLKIGLYMKVPPRTLFCGQIVATFWSCLVQVGVVSSPLLPFCLYLNMASNVGQMLIVGDEAFLGLRQH
jgi:hypothetical protein